MLCKYQNLFGKVNEGVHKYRIFNIAIVDVILTIVIAKLIHLLLPQYKYNQVLIYLFLLGIFCHRIFCVRTTIDKLLFQ